MKVLPGLYQEDFREIDGSRFNNLTERWVKFIDRRRAARINAALPKGSILDVGCGRGIFLEELKKHGWEVLGTEVFEGAQEIAKSLLIPIKTGNLKDMDITADTFEVVTLWHTLEHIEDLSILDKINKILKKNGILIVNVPNIESFQSRIFKKKWIHYNVPHHVHHFSPKSLSLLLTQYGFSPFSVKHFCFTYNFFGWLEGFIDTLFKKRNILFDELRKNTPVDMKRLALYFFTAILAIPSLCIVFIESALRRGGTFEIYARKN